MDKLKSKITTDRDSILIKRKPKDKKLRVMDLVTDYVSSVHYLTPTYLLTSVYH